MICTICHDEKSEIEELKNQIHELICMHQSINIQCAAHHEYKLKQIDRNQEINERLDKLEDYINSINGIEQIWLAINELRGKFYNTRDNLPREFSETELMIIQRLNALESDHAYKVPHKCPVCEGDGTRHGLYNNSSAPCEPCKGEGIVWG